MWHENLVILVINLPERIDRYDEIKEEMKLHHIPFERISGRTDEDGKNGAAGLWLTMKTIFTLAEARNWDKVLVFEDDAKFLLQSVGAHMEEVLFELEHYVRDWDMFYLGANVQSKLKHVPNCLKLLQCDNMLSTHAVLYNKSGWQKILQEMRNGMRKVKNKAEPIDQLYQRTVQKDGKCYVSNPILCTQRPSKSDIVGFEVDHKKHIEGNFIKRLKEMDDLNSPVSLTTETIKKAFDKLKNIEEEVITKKKHLLIEMVNKRYPDMADKIHKEGLPAQIIVSNDISREVRLYFSHFAPVVPLSHLKESSIIFSWFPNTFETRLNILPSLL